MSFRSILFDQSGPWSDSAPASGPESGTAVDGQGAPDFFTDLRLDKVVASITAGRERYRLGPFFHAPLTSEEAIAYRHEVFRDLEDPALLGVVRSFARQMQLMRDRLARGAASHYRFERARWFLDAVDVYCTAVTGLADGLTASQPRSRGFQGLRDYLVAAIASDEFGALQAETRALEADLDRITYLLQIEGARVRVSRYEPAPDYSADVAQTFEKFRQGEAKEYRFDFSSGSHMNHVEAAILDLVARLHPEVFGALDRFHGRHQHYLDETIGRFDREVQFYVAYLEYIERFRPAGLAFCYPTVTSRSKEIRARAVFDLALAEMLVAEQAPVVTNDFHLAGPERILVVSGPNQGGKTTFARTVGQLHHLARLGCPVPGVDARLFLVDRIFTHFEREEDLQSLTGKLEEDLRRIHRILEQATPASLLIMNESFGSTTLNDALFLNRAVMEAIIRRDLLCVSVTFLDELSTLGETTVSMVATVDPHDPARRTFRIVRRPADGLAYAWAIAEKYRLTYEEIKARIAR